MALSLALPSMPPPGYRVHRKAEFLVAAAAYEERGEVSRAGKEVARGIGFALRENAPVEERIEMGLELGSLYMRNERFPEALSAYRDVLEEDPKNVEALLATGGIYHDTRQPMEALVTLERVVSLEPRNVEAHARLGQLYWVTFKEAKLALEHIRSALEIDPSGPAAAGLSALAARISDRKSVV